MGVRICALAVLALCAAATAASVAHAQSAGPAKGGASPCASLGDGFVRMPGSDTCVRMRSAVQADGGSGTGVSRNSSFGNSGTALGAAGSDTQASSSDPWKQAR
ncbi:hypothetical protein V5F44_17825 [Xanthobacter sp. V2C-8]|uniref:hypothetical protein n=1 Tax=Xanthobacter albus TaxID=3119929 RepID=UPI00372BD51B